MENKVNTKKESIFSIDAVKRQREQKEIEQKLSGTSTGPISNRKVPINLTLTAEHKEKLVTYAKEKHLSASILLQIWIDKLCT